MLKKIIVACVLTGASALVLAAANRPDGYVTICKVGQTCAVSQATNVAFGASDKFVFKVLSGSFSCSPATFGSDPIPGKSVKECSVPRSGSGTSSSLASSLASSSSIPAVSSSVASSSRGPGAECVAGAIFENKTVDCGGKTLGLSCPGDGEGQPPVITLKNATVKNLRIAASGGGDGIHCVSGACRIENVVWEDICEDAASLIDSGAKLTVVGGSAYNNDSSASMGGNPDKIFQHNSKNSTLEITGGFTAKGVNGKLWRSCGDCSNNGGPRNLMIDDVKIEGKIGSIAGLNRNYGDHVKIRNLKIQGYQEGSPKVCEEWTGVIKGQGSAVKHGEFWNTDYCDVSRTDIVAF